MERTSGIVFNPETEPRIFEEKILAQFQPDADAITCLLDKTGLVIVRGQFGIGKSPFLIPALERSLNSRGIESVKVVDCQRSWDTASLLESLNKNLPVTNRGCLILDEMGAVGILEPNIISDLLSLIHGQHYKIIGIVPHSAEKNGRLYQEIPENLENAEKAASGRKGEIYDLQFTCLSVELAYELFRFHRSRFRPPNEFIEFIIRNIPLNLRILDFIALTSGYSWEGEYKQNNDLRGLILEEVLHKLDHWERLLSQEDIKRIKDLIYSTYFKKNRS